MISVCIIKSFLISVSFCVPEIRDLIMISMDGAGDGRGWEHGNIGDNTGSRVSGHAPPLFPQRSAQHLIHFTTSHTITDANDRK